MPEGSINVVIDVKGFDLVEPKIRKAMETALDKAGFQVERDAKIFAPVRTGRLRASINKQRKGLIVTVQDNVNYGIYQEYGTWKMKSHPFMRPSLEKNVAKIKQLILEEIRSALK